MEDREMKEFSWTGLFLVTGFCFFLFSAIMKLLAGEPVPIFTWIGIACVFLGSLNGIGTFILRAEQKKSN
jgi:hypothetical protein